MSDRDERVNMQRMASQDIPGEPINRRNSRRFKKLSRRLIEFSLAFGCVDPFAGYTDERSRNAEKIGWMHKQWLKVSSTITIYLAIKPLMTFLLRQIRPRQHSEQMIGKLNLLLKLIGDPYSSPPFPAMIFYMFMPVLALWIRCFLPLCAKYVQPFDCSVARLILEPEGEIRRFELKASSLLEDAIESCERSQPKLPHSQLVQHDLCAEHEEISLEQQVPEMQLREMKKVRRLIQSTMPITLKSNWRRQAQAASLTMLLAVTFVNTFVVFNSILYFTWIAWKGRCCELELLSPDKYLREETNWPKCRLLDAFNSSELLMVVEIIILSTLSISIPGATLLVFHLMQVSNQLYLADNTAEKLGKLVRELRNVREGLNERLSRQLCKNIVALWMFERESRTCVAMLAHGTRFAIFFGLFFSSVAFSTIRLQSSLEKQIAQGKVDALTAASAAIDIQPFVVGLVAGWFGLMIQLTGALVSGAMIPSQIARMDRQCSSLIAQLVRIQQSSRVSVELERFGLRSCLCRADDPITSLWRRQLLARHSDADRPAVCAFTTRLTYDRVLAMQFYLASVILMLCSYIQ